MIFSTVNITWLLLCSLPCLAIYWLWTKTKRPFEAYNIPPYPIKPWPFVGHFFMALGDLRIAMINWRQKAGDIYSLDMAGELNVVVNDFPTIKEIWIKHADSIVNCQHSFGDEILNDYNTGIFAARDENWKEQRSVSLAILRNFGMGKNIMSTRIEEEVSAFVEKIATYKGQPYNMAELTNLSVSNVICSVIVGKRFEYDDPYFVHHVKLVATLLKYLFHMANLTPFKQVSYLPGDLFHAKKWANAALEVNEKFSRAFVRKYQKEFNENEEPQNFISGYLQEMKKLADKGANTNLSEKNLVSLVRVMFHAGTETTSTTILWAVIYILHHPEIEEKIYREIEANIGTVRAPTMLDKPKLTYLNAFIQETQRMSSLVPVALHREVSETIQVAGYTIPKGSIVWAALDSVHFDKKIWGDPENFRPERFIDENGALVRREEIIPFGIGQRICLGESLARMELFLYMSTLFQRFKLEPEDKFAQLPSLKGNVGTTVVPDPFKVRFIERKA